jgi:hypothetical protein
MWKSLIRELASRGSDFSHQSDDGFVLLRGGTRERRPTVVILRIQFVSGERVRVRLRVAASSRWVSWWTGSHTGGKCGMCQVGLSPARGQHLVQLAEFTPPYRGEFLSSWALSPSTRTLPLLYSHLAWRVRQSERLASCAHAHPHSMALNGLPSSTIFGPLSHNRFVSSGIRQTGTSSPMLIRTTAYLPPPSSSSSSSPSYLLGLMLSRSVSLLCASSRSSHGRLLRHHGEKKSHA